MATSSAPAPAPSTSLRAGRFLSFCSFCFSAIASFLLAIASFLAGLFGGVFNSVMGGQKRSQRAKRYRERMAAFEMARAARAMVTMELNGKPGDGVAAGDDPPLPVEEEEEYDPVKEAEKEVHRGFMNEALDMARLALRTNETPVGCVLVHHGRIIAKGMNATNITRNGTRHAEFMAITALLSYTPQSELESTTTEPQVPTDQDWGDVDPSGGHVYPYGQKLHPAPRVHPKFIAECILYVTVEPCVMCASLLRQYGIQKVYFGAVNDKFGGTGGVFRIHKNSNPVTGPPPTSNVGGPLWGVGRPAPVQKSASVAGVVGEETNQNLKYARPNRFGQAKVGPSGYNLPKDANGVRPTATIAIAEGTIPDAREGDGGNVESGYDVEGGWGRDEAVNLLRQFYVQENGRAPVPRKKEGRAARLAAMMEKDGLSTDRLIVPLPNGSTSSPVSPVEEQDPEADVQSEDSAGVFGGGALNNGEPNAIVAAAPVAPMANDAGMTAIGAPPRDAAVAEEQTA